MTRELFARGIEWVRVSFDRATTFRLATIAILAGCCLLALDRMRRRSLHLESHLVRPEAIRFVETPDWTNAQILQSIQASAPAPLSIFAPDLFEKVRLSYAANPWVDRVIEGERQYPDKVRLSLRLKKPVALVRFDGARPRYYLIDSEGRRLPGYLAAPPTSFPYPLPVLAGIRGIAPRDVGKSFTDPAVALGARLAIELYEWHNSVLYPEIRVVEIDLGNLNGRENPMASEVLLRTNESVVIHWGRAPRPVLPVGEPSTRDKVALVAKARDAYPSFLGVAAVKLHLGELLVEIEEGSFGTTSD